VLQDNDRSQYDFVSQLYQLSGGAVFLVGDLDQAIYQFRGADVRIPVLLSNSWSSSPHFCFDTSMQLWCMVHVVPVVCCCQGRLCESLFELSLSLPIAS
jgi:hypothetical protein